jgi:K+-transporting ATPase A subunit
MTANGWLQIGFFLLVILAITKPVGLFMARVFNREKTFLDFALRPVERLTYRLCGIREDHGMRWTEYGAAMLLFSAASMILLISSSVPNTGWLSTRKDSPTLVQTWHGTPPPRSPQTPTGSLTFPKPP